MTTQKQKTILLIDDDQQFRDYMYDMLIDQNYHVLLAENGEAGLTQYSSNKPDIIITDIVMPEKEGIEVVLTIRDKDPEIPIVAISGGNFGNAASYLKMVSKLGVNATLGKPFSKDEILEVLDDLLVS